MVWTSIQRAVVTVTLWRGNFAEDRAVFWRPGGKANSQANDKYPLCLGKNCLAFWPRLCPVSLRSDLRWATKEAGNLKLYCQCCAGEKYKLLNTKRVYCSLWAMADSFGDESSSSALGLDVTTGQGSGASQLPILSNSLPVGMSATGGVHSSSNPTSPPLAVAAQSGLTAVVAPMSAVTATPVSFGNTLTPGSSPPVVAVSPTLHASSPLPGVGLGAAGAGLLSQINATSWDPTLSTDWDNEKASQQCILRIKR